MSTLFINLGFLTDADAKFQVLWSVNVKPEIVFLYYIKTLKRLNVRLLSEKINKIIDKNKRSIVGNQKNRKTRYG